MQEQKLRGELRKQNVPASNLATVKMFGFIVCLFVVVFCFLIRNRYNCTIFDELVFLTDRLSACLGSEPVEKARHDRQ